MSWLSACLPACLVPVGDAGRGPEIREVLLLVAGEDLLVVEEFVHLNDNNHTTITTPYSAPVTNPL